MRAAGTTACAQVQHRTHCPSPDIATTRRVIDVHTGPALVGAPFPKPFQHFAHQCTDDLSPHVVGHRPLVLGTHGTKQPQHPIGALNRCADPPRFDRLPVFGVKARNGATGSGQQVAGLIRHLRNALGVTPLENGVSPQRIGGVISATANGNHHARALKITKATRGDAKPLGKALLTDDFCTHGRL
jgi:hypothetical protein